MLGHKTGRSMLVRAHQSQQAGVTLIELVIGIAIIAILLTLSLPSMQLWMRDLQIRAGAESILEGLQLARQEAVRRNANVIFTLTSAGGLTDWTVTDLSTAPVTVIQSRSSAAGTPNARLIASTALAQVYTNTPTAVAVLPAGVTFNGTGRVNAGANLTRIDVTNVQSIAARRLVITIAAGGQMRLCDPAFTLANSSQGCV